MYSPDVSPDILAARADLLNKNKSSLALVSTANNDIFLHSYENKHGEFSILFLVWGKKIEMLEADSPSYLRKPC